MNFLIEDADLIKKCNTIWDKAGADIKNKDFLKTKIKSHGDKVTDFYDPKKS